MAFCIFFLGDVEPCMSSVGSNHSCGSHKSPRIEEPCPCSCGSAKLPCPVSWGCNVASVVQLACLRCPSSRGWSKLPSARSDRSGLTSDTGESSPWSFTGRSDSVGPLLCSSSLGSFGINADMRGDCWACSMLSNKGFLTRALCCTCWGLPGESLLTWAPCWGLPHSNWSLAYNMYETRNLIAST